MRRDDPNSLQLDLEECERIDREQREAREKEIRKQYARKRILTVVHREMNQIEPHISFESYEDYLNYAVSVKENCESEIRGIREHYNMFIDFEKKDISKLMIIASIILIVGAFLSTFAFSSAVLSDKANLPHKATVIAISLLLSCAVFGAIIYAVIKPKIRKHRECIREYENSMSNSEKKSYADNAKKVKYLFNETFLLSISDVPDDVSFVNGLPVTEDKRYIVYRAITGQCHHSKSWCRGNAFSPVNYFLIRDKLYACSFCGKTFHDIEWFDKYTAMTKIQQYFVNKIPALEEVIKNSNNN